MTSRGSDAPAASSEEMPRVIEIDHERSPEAEQALLLIRSSFPAQERQPIEQIAMEVEEKRLGLLTSYDFHLFAGVEAGGGVVAVASGVYLGGVNTGFITYLAVEESYRQKQLGRRIRGALVDAFERDARTVDWSALAAVVGEVRLDSPWLQRLVRERAVLPLDLEYHHPGHDPASAVDRWVLYREPIADSRPALPPGEVRQLLYAIWRRAYRVRWPLEREGFHAMLKQLEGMDAVGAHPEVQVDHTAS